MIVRATGHNRPTDRNHFGSQRACVAHDLLAVRRELLGPRARHLHRDGDAPPNLRPPSEALVPGLRQPGPCPTPVISADGINIEPFSTTKIEIATAETYDVLITVPDDGSFELRATSSDITGYSSGYFGNGMETKATDLPKLNYFFSYLLPLYKINTH